MSSTNLEQPRSKQQKLKIRRNNERLKLASTQIGNIALAIGGADFIIPAISASIRAEGQATLAYNFIGQLFWLLVAASYILSHTPPWHSYRARIDMITAQTWVNFGAPIAALTFAITVIFVLARRSRQLQAERPAGNARATPAEDVLRKIAPLLPNPPGSSGERPYPPSPANPNPAQG